MTAPYRTAPAPNRRIKTLPATTSTELTRAQRRVLLTLQRLWSGQWPTVRAVCDGLGVDSTNTVQGHLERLVAKGALTDVRRAEFGEYPIRVYTHSEPGLWTTWLVSVALDREALPLEAEVVAPDASTAILWATLLHEDWPAVARLREAHVMAVAGRSSAGEHLPVKPLRWSVVVRSKGTDYPVTVDAYTRDGALAAVAADWERLRLGPVDRSATTVTLAPTQPELGDTL